MDEQGEVILAIAIQVLDQDLPWFSLATLAPTIVNVLLEHAKVHDAGPSFSSWKITQELDQVVATVECQQVVFAIGIEIPDMDSVSTTNFQSWLTACGPARWRSGTPCCTRTDADEV